MPRAVTAFGVKIASPGDARMELTMAREVIGEWNALHGLEQGRILLPLASKGTSDSPRDLLVAIFCMAQGDPAESSSPGIELEIEKQLQERRPALIYFSEGRTDFAERDADQSRAWDDFKKRFAGETVLDSFGDEKEFRAKFARQLDETVGTHSHFKTDLDPVSASAPVALSAQARELLVEACDDPEAYIGRSRDNNGLKLQANGRQFVPVDDPAAMAVWEKAFDELVAGELIRDAGCKGRLFQISPQGFAYLKSIGKAPVGYIAELGGM